MRGDPINQAQPVNYSHPLNQGRVAWYLTLPHVVGGGAFYDLISCRPLTASNGPAWSPASRPGGEMMITYNGTTSYHSGTDAGLPAGSSPRSMACWFKVPGTYAGYRTIVGYGNSGSYNEASLILIGTSTEVAAIKNKFMFSQWGASACGGTVVTDNQWRHGVFTWDGTTPKIYINGIDDNTVITGTFAVGTTLRSLELGRDSTATNYNNGSIDDISIYNRALTVNEVMNLYAESIAGYPTMLSRLESPLIRSSPQGGPFPWFMDQSAMSGGLQTLGL